MGGLNELRGAQLKGRLAVLSRELANAYPSLNDAEHSSSILLQHFAVILATVFPDSFVIGGAQALRARYGDYRITRDIDLDMTGSFDDEKFSRQLKQMSEVSNVEFKLAGLPKRHKANEGINIRITVSSDGIYLGMFKVDLSPNRNDGLSDKVTIVSPVTGRTATASIMSSDKHLANKLSTLHPRIVPGREGNDRLLNTHRYHDLVDVAIMAQSTSFDLKRVTEYFAEAVNRVKYPVRVERTLQVPGEDWNTQTWEQARQTKMWPEELTIEKALEIAKPLADRVFESYIDGNPYSSEIWNPREQAWEARPDTTLLDVLGLSSDTEFESVNIRTARTDRPFNTRSVRQAEDSSSKEGGLEH